MSLELPQLIADSSSNLLAARNQMGFTLGFHIVLACFGVAFPAIMLIAEYRGRRKNDAEALLLARRWSKAVAVLFAVGAVSGTVLSFELGLLWPGMMDRFGDAFGIGFAIEGIFFFLEAIFIAIYIYGWDRLPGWAHFWSGVPIVIAGIGGAASVIAANSWMNTPQGFELGADGRITDVDVADVLLNPPSGTSSRTCGSPPTWSPASSWPRSTPSECCAAAATATTGSASSSPSASLRSSPRSSSSSGTSPPARSSTTSRSSSPPSSASTRPATTRPSTSAGSAPTTRSSTRSRSPGSTRCSPGSAPRPRSQGLDQIPDDEEPPALTLLHLSFDTMVGIGTALLLLGLWFGITYWRKRDIPATPWFLRAAAVAGAAAVVAMWCGWIVTEVGRQPWIVHGFMRTEDAVTPAQGLWWAFGLTMSLYAALAVVAVVVLRGMSRRWREEGAPELEAPYSPPPPAREAPK